MQSLLLALGVGESGAGSIVRFVAGRTQSVGTLLMIEKEHLIPLHTEDFDLPEVSFSRVDQAGCAKVRTITKLVDDQQLMG